MDNQENNPVKPIDLSIFKEHTCQSFLNILDQMLKEDKILIMEESCKGKLNYLTSMEPLDERND